MKRENNKHTLPIYSETKASDEVLFWMLFNPPWNGFEQVVLFAETPLTVLIIFLGQDTKKGIINLKSQMFFLLKQRFDKLKKIIKSLSVCVCFFVCKPSESEQPSCHTGTLKPLKVLIYVIHTSMCCLATTKEKAHFLAFMLHFTRPLHYIFFSQ